MSDGFVVHAYDKIYNEYYSKARDINYHKRMAKMYFKLFKKDFENDFKTISCSVSKYVYDNLPFSKPDFKFTLMNAQHIYAKCLFFNSWDDLRSFCCEAN